MGVTKQEIEHAVLTPFRNAGWVKKRRSAYKAGAGVSGVINVQGSGFDGLQFVNVGFWFPERADEQLPYYQCPVLFRLERLYPEHREELLRTATQEDGSPEGLEWLARFVSEVAEPGISALLSRDSLRAALQSERLEQARVTFEARAALGL